MPEKSEGLEIEIPNDNINETNDVEYKKFFAFDCCYDGWYWGITKIICTIFGLLTFVYGILSSILFNIYSYDDIDLCYNEYMIMNNSTNKTQEITKVEQTEYNAAYIIALFTAILTLISLLLGIYLFYCISAKLVDKEYGCTQLTVWMYINICSIFTIIGLGWICPAFGCVGTTGYLGTDNLCMKLDYNEFIAALIAINQYCTIGAIGIVSTLIAVAIAIIIGLAKRG